MRRKITVLITFLAGLYFFLEFMLPPVIPVGAAEGEGFRFGRFDEQITIGFTAVGAMAFALGAISILRAHGGNILRRRKRWLVSTALVISLAVSCVIGFGMWAARVRSARMPRHLEGLAAAQGIIISSAETPPVPAHMKELPAEDLPPELQRTATLEERTAAQAKLVAAVARAAADLAAQTRPPTTNRDAHPSDELAQALATATTTSSSALGKMQAEDEAGAAVDLAASLQALQAAATSQRKIANLVLEDSTANKLYDLMFDGFYVALGSAMFSLLAFYIATAAYRAFRIQSRESALLMVAALLVMLGQIPVGVWLADGLFRFVGLDGVSITQVRLWILRVINTAAFRGIALGSAIAGLSMAWRVWWSMESGAFLDGPSPEDSEDGAGDSGGSS